MGLISLTRLSAMLLTVAALCLSGGVLTAAAPLRVGQTITAQEAPTGSLMFGVGVNSDSGLTGSIILNEQNFAYWLIGMDELLSGDPFLVAKEWDRSPEVFNEVFNFGGFRR